MTHIVAAHVGTQERADVARRALADAGYSGQQIEVFYVTPPGEHGKFPIGGDRAADPGAERAGEGAVKGAAIGTAVGVAAGVVAAAAVPLLAPAVMAGVAGTGALGGAIAGGLNEAGKTPTDHGGSGTTDAEQRAPGNGQDAEQHRIAEQRAQEAQRASGTGTHPSGLMIAVDVGSPERAAPVARALSDCGADRVQAVDGQWRDGHWVDFDPLRAMPGPRDGAL